MPRSTSRILCLLVALGVCLTAAPTALAVDTPFSSRFSQTLRGDIRAVGNTLLTCPAANADCANAQAGTGTLLDNNDFVMGNVDVDSDPATFNSSSATVSLPAGSTVVWAGLYWAADTSAGVSGVVAPSAASRGSVSFDDSSGYQTISALPADVRNLTGSRYRAFADVTSLLPAAGDGTYTVANVQSGTGQDRFAGWSLLVAYRDDTQAMHRLNVVDGVGTVQSGDDFAASIGSFFTPSSGPVNATLGLISFEGDASYFTESMTFNGAPFSDAPLNPATNVFNSTIASNGAHATAKNPNYVNQMGIDIDSSTQTGLLTNNQSSAALLFSSTTEFYMPVALYLVSDEGPAINTAVPTISGTPVGGATLTADPGTWQGTPTITYGYQWQRCDVDGLNCVDIAGATDDTYVITDEDARSTIVVVVIASNDAGASLPAASAPTAAVPAEPPANTVAPAISGEPTNGETLTADPGTWTGTGPIDFAYQWQLCDADGSNCVDIAGATDDTYVLAPGDVGNTIVVVVTGTNDAGSDPAASAPSAVVTAVPVPDPTPTPTPTAPATTPAAGTPAAVVDAQVEDLSTVPANLVAEASCQQLAGNSKFRRVKLAGIGTVRLRAYTSGPALRLTPMQVTTQVTGGRARSVKYTLDGKALKAKKGRRSLATVTPARLQRVGTHTLKAMVKGRKGKAKPVVLALKTVPCKTLFTAQRWKTNAGAGLRLRIDARTALERVAYKVPAGLLPKQTTKVRKVGFVRFFVAGGARQRFDLTLPRKGTKPALLSGSGKPAIAYVRGGLEIAGMPARAAVAEITLYRVTKLDKATKPKVVKLSARVLHAGFGQESFSARPKAPR